MTYKMNHTKTLSLLLFFGISFTLSASMLCPGDKYLYCDDDIHNLYVTGKPQLFGSHSYHTPHYEDQYFTNACNVGHIIRKWYLDLNYNGVADYTEPTCYQDIYLQERTYGGIYISYPKDITVSCLEEIPFESPNIIGKPCDLLGYTYEDKIYNVLGSGETGCKKILRKFTIINWCDYDPNGNNNNGSVWTGTQIIKVLDDEKPSFVSCNDVTIGFNSGCKSIVTLKSKAIDEGSCASAKLYWTAEVDIYGDGIMDYYFSHSVLGDFNIPLKNNNEEVQIKLPGSYGQGVHKVIWRVRDACGNFTSCSTTFTTKDNKPPTPYCIQNVSVSFDGQDPWPLKVNASMFNLGAFDNCSASQYIRHSFSTNPADSIRMFTCANAGFQTLQVYSFDLAGNYSWCDLNIGVFDNGSCQGTLSAAGRVASPKGKALISGRIEMESNEGQLVYYRNIENGAYLFENIDLNRDLKIIPNRTGLDDGQINMVDYVIFRNYLMSIDTLTPLGYLAGDINDDKRANSKDMVLMKDLLLNDKTSFGPNDWRFIPSYLKPESVTLKNYSPVYDGRKFAGTLDFLCFAKGDFSETLPVETEAGNRANEKKLVYLGEQITIEGENYLPLLTHEDVDMEGMKLSVNVNAEDIKHADFEFDFAAIAENKTNILFTKKTSFNKGDALFFIKSAKVFDLSVDGYMVSNENLNIIDLELIPFTKDNFVYPNPAVEYVTILVNKHDVISISDIDGRIIHNEVIQDLKQRIDVSNFRKGLYFVSVNNGKRIGKFIKN